MRAAVALVALALLTGATPRFHRTNSRTPQGRSDRGLIGTSLAFFEAFPASGAGTTTACSTTAPTAGRGEGFTFSRASSATCTKTASGGLATTGIANGDLVSLSSNVARVEYDTGVLGLLVESSRTNVLLRYIEYANAAWADVGTPTLTGSQTDPFGTTTAVQFDDNDGAAYEGRSQSVTVSAGAPYFMHCFVKAGTSAEARITLDGTAAAITGLSATTWSIIEVADASSSGVSIATQVLVGDDTADTGTVIFGGCQVEAGTYRTSIIPTTAAGVARSAETGSFTLPASTGQINCVGARVTNNPLVSPASGHGRVAYLNATGADYFDCFERVDVDTIGIDATLSGAARSALGAGLAWKATAATGNTIACEATDSTNFNRHNNGTSFPAAVAAYTAPTWASAVVEIGTLIGAGSYQIDGILSRLKLDPVSTGCR